MVSELKTARFEKDEFGLFQIVDTRNNMILKRNVKKISKAAAYVDYFTEEHRKAEQLWCDYDNRKG
tara:strand:+ start:162 stop:359 length:198 start_codon:yes stop_codon:yes gene_type:complete